jgi:hypothetical protein
VEDFFAVFWILIVAAIVVTVFVFQWMQSQALDETYSRVATRFRGQSRHGGVFGRPAFHFHHAGTFVRVDIYSTGGKSPTYYTQVHLAWPDPRARCEIYPERFTSRVGKMLGMADVEIGSPDFDRDFIITGSSPRDLREFLTPPVQAVIYRLRRMHGNDYVYVSIGGGNLLVKKLGLIRSDDSLIEYVDAALELYECALGGAAAGIEIVGDAPLASSEIVCQICGEQIEHELVHCRRCKTPHHEDCWEYFGGCSTFGCGETRYTPSQS